MRIVHSFWSKPMLDEEGLYLSNLSYGSWVNKQMFYYTYVLSALLINKHYKGNTTLVTDKFGKKLLIDTLKLPYDEVIVELDYLNNYPKQFWALGKIYAYSLFDEPFIHLDYDFLLSKPFSHEFENADLVAYMDENDKSRQGPYKKCVNQYFVNYTLPESVEYHIKNYRNIAYNAGVFGGNKTQIFKELWANSKEIIDLNLSKIVSDAAQDTSSFTMTNVILEQYLFACMAQDKDLKVACLHQNENLLPDESNFWLSENNLPKYKAQYYPKQYVHMVGHHKASINNAIDIERILREIAPEYISLISNLFIKKQI
jgi:hypothetical protein